MRNNNKKFFIAFCVFVFLCFSVLTQGVLAQGDTPKKEDYGLGETAKQGFGKETAEKMEGTDIPSLIGQIVGAGLSFIGVLFFILVIYGGFLWMTARGNEEQVTKAKELIRAAIIGLIIIVAAYAIAFFIFSYLGRETLGPGGGGSGGSTGCPPGQIDYSQGCIEPGS